MTPRPPDAPTRLGARPAGWRPAQLLSAPHRLFFLAGAVLWSGITLWWALLMLTPWTGGSPRWGLPPGAAHGLLMSFGFMPLFIAGFLYTAAPKWLKTPASDRRLQWLAAGAISTGWLMVLAGVHTQGGVAGVGLIGVASGWTAVAGGFRRMYRRSRVEDRLHAGSILVALWLLALALWLAVAAIVAGHDTLLRIAVRLGLWGGVASVFVVAAHRLTPFLHIEHHARLAQGLLMPVLLGLGLWLASDLLWLMPATAWRRVAHGVLAVPGALLAVAIWRAAFAAELARARRAPMLRMLHTAFVWLGLAFALKAVEQAQAAVGGAALSSLAPLHALTLGFMATVMLAMTSRVAAVQQGRTVAIDALVLAMHGLLQLSAVLRVLAALWPAAPAWLMPGAALAFALLALGWTLRYGRWLGLA